MQPDRNRILCLAATVGLLRRSHGALTAMAGAMGQGKCSSCGYLVHSFAFNDGLPLDIFLSALLSSFPDAACKLHFGPPATPSKSPRGSLIA